MLASGISQGSGEGWPGISCRGPTWLTAQLRMSCHSHFVGIALKAALVNEPAYSFLATWLKKASLPVFKP